MISDVIKFIKQYRDALMGISIIFILLYHAYSWIPPEENPYYIFFKYGYATVDIFMLLSGFGLCYSYTKNSVKRFYYRRFIKIIPLNIISGLIVSFFVYSQSKEISPWDIFCNISTLSYYGLGGIYWNWFIPSILLLYILLRHYHSGLILHDYHLYLAQLIFPEYILHLYMYFLKIMN